MEGLNDYLPFSLTNFFKNLLYATRFAKYVWSESNSEHGSINVSTVVGQNAARVCV